jgi:ribosomal protein S27AE
MRELARMPFRENGRGPGGRTIKIRRTGRRITMSNRELADKLMELGPEKVVDAHEFCPQCWGLSLGIHMDGETIMHCSTCHDQHAVTVEDANRWREAMRKRAAG